MPEQVPEVGSPNQPISLGTKDLERGYNPSTASVPESPDSLYANRAFDARHQSNYEDAIEEPHWNIGGVAIIPVVKRTLSGVGSQRSLVIAPDPTKDSRRIAEVALLTESPQQEKEWVTLPNSYYDTTYKRRIVPSAPAGYSVTYKPGEEQPTTFVAVVRVVRPGKPNVYWEISTAFGARQEHFDQPNVTAQVTSIPNPLAPKG